MAWESGEHQHLGDYRRCASCGAKWQPADLRPVSERSAPRASRRDDMIGRAVFAPVGYETNMRGAGMFRVYNVAGQVWAEADSSMTPGRGRVYWIATVDQRFVCADADTLEVLDELPEPPALAI